MTNFSSIPGDIKLQDNTEKRFGHKVSNTEIPKESGEEKSIKILCKHVFLLD